MAHTGTMGHPVPEAQPGVRITIGGLQTATATTIGAAGLGSGAAGRKLPVTAGTLVDDFDPFAVHLYEIVPQAGGH